MAASKRGIKLDEWNITWDEYKELDYFCRQYDRKRAEAAAMLTLRISTPEPVRMKDGSGMVSDVVFVIANGKPREYITLHNVLLIASYWGEEGWIADGLAGIPD